MICFIEITSILAHLKRQLNQAANPYSINVVKGRGFLFLTMRFSKIFSSLMLKNFLSHLT